MRSLHCRGLSGYTSRLVDKTDKLARLWLQLVIFVRKQVRLPCFCKFTLDSFTSHIPRHAAVTEWKMQVRPTDATVEVHVRRREEKANRSAINKALASSVVRGVEAMPQGDRT